MTGAWIRSESCLGLGLLFENLLEGRVDVCDFLGWRSVRRELYQSVVILPAERGNVRLTWWSSSLDISFSRPFTEPATATADCQQKVHEGNMPRRVVHWTYCGMAPCCRRPLGLPRHQQERRRWHPGSFSASWQQVSRLAQSRPNSISIGSSSQPERGSDDLPWSLTRSLPRTMPF